MAALRVRPPRGGLGGTVVVPGDKSMAHRALLLGALAEGTTTVTGFPGGADVLSTLGVVRALGADGTRHGEEVRVVGRGAALGADGRVHLDCGNSGTTMRLTAGLVAGGGATAVLDGDASLRRRPMERVAVPLRIMGAVVHTTDGHAPLTVEGRPLAGVEWTLPVASAQLKSAVLLAALRARGVTRVHEPLASRDHTERMLGHFGVPIARGPGWVEVAGGGRLTGSVVPLPGDISSAAFLVVAGLLVPGSEVWLPDVGVNPTRTGIIAILRRMGATVELSSTREAAGEPRADLIVRGARLHGTVIGATEVPAAIDELPIVCVAAALAEGKTVITGAAELRVKESDRIAALEQLRACGVGVETSAEGLVIQGTGGRRLRGARIEARGDHRVAMAFAVAGLVAEDGVVIADPECVDVSFPGFFARLAELGAVVEDA